MSQKETKNQNCLLILDNIIVYNISRKIKSRGGAETAKIMGGKKDENKENLKDRSSSCSYW